MIGAVPAVKAEIPRLTYLAYRKCHAAMLICGSLHGTGDAAKLSCGFDGRPAILQAFKQQYIAQHKYGAENGNPVNKTRGRGEGNRSSIEQSHGMSNVPPEILSAVDSYERGRITLDEAMLRIFGAIGNTSDALTTLEFMSLEWKIRIWENVDAAPTHDDQWNRTRILCIGTYSGEDAADRIAHQNREAIGRYRLGIECLRELNRTT